MKLAYSLLFFILCSCTTTLFAQETNKVADSIAEKIYWYSLQKPSSSLFVHFDKNVYTNNESAWFTGYLLKKNAKEQPDVLSVALIRNDDRSVLAEGKFVMNAGLSFGNLYVPDSLPTGDYSFICYTNYFVNGTPTDVFIQPVTIKTTNIAGFVANISLVDSIKPGMDSATVLLKAYTADATLVKGGAVTYFIGDRTHPLETGKIKTDKFGEAKISIPLKQITSANNVLQTEITNGKEVKAISIKLPVYKKETVIKFYPEGGSLVNGAKNTVGWEVINSDGEPQMVNAVLYQNNQPFQTIQTNAYGIGKFSFTPKVDCRYIVKLQTTDYSKDSAYLLPLCLQAGPVINTVNALATDTLDIQLNTQQQGSKWIVLVHNYQTTFVTASIASAGTSMLLKVPLTEVPKGLNTFTLLDTLGRPRAERLFFAHYDKKALVHISTDSAAYSTRQKVVLKFKVTDAEQQPLRSLVSIACAQDNRFELKKLTDIESYTYLQHEMTSIPFKNKLMGNEAESKEYLENILLIKGWRRYTWQQMEMVKAADTIQHAGLLTFEGAAWYNNKPLKKPVQLSITKFITAKMSASNIISTDSAGNFELLSNNVQGAPNKQLRLTVNNRLQEFYTITLDDPYKKMNKKLAGSLVLNNYNLKSFSQTSQSVVLKKEEGGKRLLDVVVTAKQDNRIFSAREPGPNLCGDYVCMYGNLNCPNHSEGFAPIVGITYNHKSAGSKTTYPEVYQGCEALRTDLKKQFLKEIDGIYTKKEFYVTDLSKADISDGQYLSTIYWNHSVLTSNDGQSEATFYTGDIPGKFRIVIQGITNNNVVYGEQFFEVKKQ